MDVCEAILEALTEPLTGIEVYDLVKKKGDSGWLDPSVVFGALLALHNEGKVEFDPHRTKPLFSKNGVYIGRIGTFAKARVKMGACPFCYTPGRVGEKCRNPKCGEGRRRG